MHGHNFITLVSVRIIWLIIWSESLYPFFNRYLYLLLKSSNGFIWFCLFNNFIFQKFWFQVVCIHLWNINSSNDGTPESWRNYWNIFWFFGLNNYLFTSELLSHLSLRSQNSVSLKRKAHFKDKTAHICYPNRFSRHLLSGFKIYIVLLFFFYKEAYFQIQIYRIERFRHSIGSYEEAYLHR